jgi:hypothetical protein
MCLACADETESVCDRSQPGRIAIVIGRPRSRYRVSEVQCRDLGVICCPDVIIASGTNLVGKQSTLCRLDPMLTCPFEKGRASSWDNGMNAIVGVPRLVGDSGASRVEVSSSK